MNLINELRMLAEDLYSAGGHNRYASAMSKAADELAKVEAMERQRPEPVARIVGEIGEWVSNGEGTYSLGGRLDAFVPLRNGTLLYALPGPKEKGNK